MSLPLISRRFTYSRTVLVLKRNTSAASRRVRNFSPVRGPLSLSCRCISCPRLSIFFYVRIIENCSIRYILILARHSSLPRHQVAPFLEDGTKTQATDCVPGRGPGLATSICEQMRATVCRCNRNSLAIRAFGQPSANLARTISASAPSTRFAGFFLGTR